MPEPPWKSGPSRAALIKEKKENNTALPKAVAAERSSQATKFRGLSERSAPLKFISTSSSSGRQPLRRRFPDHQLSFYNRNSMQPARIAELLEPFLGSTQGPTPGTGDLLANISTYIDILVRWNARINLTAIRDPEEIVTRHFGESFFAARRLFRGERPALQGRVTEEGQTGASAPARETVADIGSGAGFPGIPLKLWAPQIALTLIESNQKKVAFLREVTRALTLTDIDIQNVRAEDLRQTFNLVTLRAVERFDKILPIAVSLVATAGRLALLIGRSQLEQATSAPSLAWQAPVPIPLSRSRILLLGTRSQPSHESSE
jgi:16S rRNA (guanine527-N7)-methyltransferase